MSTPAWEQIRAFVGHDLTDEALADAQRLLTACGSRLFVEELAHAHFTHAQAVVEELGIATDLIPAITACLPALSHDQEVAA